MAERNLGEGTKSKDLSLSSEEKKFNLQATGDANIVNEEETSAELKPILTTLGQMEIREGGTIVEKNIGQERKVEDETFQTETVGQENKQRNLMNRVLMENFDKDKTTKTDGQEYKIRAETNESVVRALYFCEPGTESSPCLFVVTELGLKVETPYCILRFPPGCVSQNMEIKLTPIYYYYEINLPGRAFITPHIKFENKKKMSLSFLENVEVNLKTSYSATDVEKPVEVEIMRKTGSSIEENFSTTSLKNERLITFVCKQFCQFAGHVAVTQREQLSRSYYCAGWVRSSSKAAVAEALVYEDMADTRQLNLQYLNGKPKLLSPECFTISFEGELEVELKDMEDICKDVVEIKSTGERLVLAKYFGKKLDSKFQLRIKPNENIPSQTQLGMNYKINIYRGVDLYRTEVSKTCYLKWMGNEDQSKRDDDDTDILDFT